MKVLPPYRWWEIEDHGGFPPFWCGEPGDRWPSEWNRRPHP